MKKIIAVTALVFSTQAMAMTWDGYEFATAKVESCNFVKLGATLGYLTKQAGQPLPPLPTADATETPFAIKAMYYGYNEAVSREDAETHAWGDCMDNFTDAAHRYAESHNGKFK